MEGDHAVDGVVTKWNGEAGEGVAGGGDDGGFGVTAGFRRCLIGYTYIHMCYTFLNY